MKRKIEQFANGIFSYEKPKLIVSEDLISIDAVSGKVAELSFTVKNDMQKQVRGFCKSENVLISFKKESFEGIENVVEFTFDAKNLDAGNLIKTTIEVITDCGEYEIGVDVRIVSSYIETSVGQTFDMYHYANLAMLNPQEAKDLFKTEEFKSIVIGHNPEYRNLYRNLSGTANTALALEEFLIAAKKKKPVEFLVDANELVYEAGNVSFMDKLAIKKSNWGYAQLRIDTEGDFIETERSLIWAEDFEDGVFWLKFIINPEKLRFGRSFGRIKISTLGDEVIIPIVCNKSPLSGKNHQMARKNKEYQAKLLNNHIRYILDRTDAKSYVREAEALLAILKTFRHEGTMLKLYRVYLEYVSGNEDNARKQYQQLSQNEDLNQDSYIIGADAYVRGVIALRQDEANECGMVLRRLYESEKKLVFLILFLWLDDRDRMSKRQKLDELRNCFYQGECNVFGLIEASKILAMEPMLLKESGRFELAVINEGLKQGTVTKFLEMQLAYVAAKAKNTSKLLLSVLKKCYENTAQKEMLEAICTHIIMQDIDYKKEYSWLEKGVNNQLRIKGLYEKCLEAADTDSALLPRPLLNYFAAGAELKPALAEKLYSNIIRFCNKNENIYIMYRTRMKLFAEEALKNEVFNADLALIYENSLVADEMDDKMIACLPYIMYKHEITTDWKKVKTVAVSHKEMREPEFAKAENGTAIADIFTDEPVIVLINDEGDRCIASFNIEVKRMIQRQDLLELMYEKCRNDKRVLLNRLEAAQYEGKDDELISYIAKCTEGDYIEESFMLECRRRLIEYYYENLEGELLESNLVRLELKCLSHRERIRMMEFMITRELFTLAIKNMEKYGFYGINPKRICKLCSSLIMVNSEQTSTVLFMKLCEYCFEKRKVDDLVLGFLEKNYEGSTQGLYDLWNFCRETGIDTTDLEERMLRTALFAENDMIFVKDVFRIYYGHCSSGKLVRAFLSHLAYEYLVCDRVLDREMLEIMRREANYSENDICTLAILKDYSSRKSFTEQEKSYIEFQLKKMETRGYLMPFFKNFPPEIRIPKQMRDKYFVEYHTEQGRRVRIHYCFVDSENGEGYSEDEMKDIGFGIYVKDFIIFYGEVMQYYISEAGEEQNTITESQEISLEPELYGCEENRYHQLNLIITAKTMNDEKTVIKLIDNYTLNDYAVKRLFMPIINSKK